MLLKPSLKLIKFCQSGKISPNLVTLSTVHQVLQSIQYLFECSKLSCNILLVYAKIEWMCTRGLLKSNFATAKTYLLFLQHWHKKCRPTHHWPVQQLRADHFHSMGRASSQSCIQQQLGSNGMLASNIGIFFFKWPIPSLFFFIFVYSIQFTVNVQYQFSPMTGFELQTSGIGSDRSTN